MSMLDYADKPIVATKCVLVHVVNNGSSVEQAPARGEPTPIMPFWYAAWAIFSVWVLFTAHTPYKGLVASVLVGSILVVIQLFVWHVSHLSAVSESDDSVDRLSYIDNGVKYRIPGSTIIGKAEVDHEPRNGDYLNRFTIHHTFYRDAVTGVLFVVQVQHGRNMNGRPERLARMVPMTSLEHFYKWALAIFPSTDFIDQDELAKCRFMTVADPSVELMLASNGSMMITDDQWQRMTAPPEDDLDAVMAEIEAEYAARKAARMAHVA